MNDKLSFYWGLVKLLMDKAASKQKHKQYGKQV